MDNEAGMGKIVALLVSGFPFLFSPFCFSLALWRCEGARAGVICWEE